MLIGKPGAAKTAIAAASSDRVVVRGRDLAGDLMGRTTFTEFFYLAATGREPTEEQRFFLDLALVAIAEHGLTPSVQAARMTYAADPAALQGAVAAGVLGCGTVILGASDLCRQLIEDVLARAELIGSVEEAARAVAREHRELGRPIAGFGHPLHKPVDPRAERMIALARERRVAGRSVEAAVALTKAVAEAWGKPLPMNVSMAIAATLRDAGVPPAVIRAVPILARTAGLIAHLVEEAEAPIGFLSPPGRGGDRPRPRRNEGRRLMPMVEPDVESAPWEDEARADAPLYLRQIEYLFERSRFYRSKLERAGFATHGAVGGLDAIHALPLTEKDELRASRTPEEPIGTHLTAAPEEIARIYSTSGTTGTPSYIALTAADLEVWVRTSARSYAASGVAKGERIVSTYNAGPFVAGAALDAFERLGLCHIPVGTGNTERLMAAVELLKPTAAVMTPSYALHLAEWARRRGVDLAQSSVQRVMVAGEPGGGEPAMRARLETAWGASVTEAMGIGDISVSLWGECEEKAGMHFSGRRFVHIELIDPESGASKPIVDGAEGELVLTHLVNRSAPLLRFRTRDHVRMSVGPCPCGRMSPRVRCIGRTDDMLIVRGVNVFPSAVREVVNEFAPAVSGVVLIRPRAKGVRQEPPLPVSVEMAPGVDAEGLAERIRTRIREKLIVTTEVDLKPPGSLPRSEYKSKLVEKA